MKRLMRLNAFIFPAKPMFSRQNYDTRSTELATLSKLTLSTALFLRMSHCLRALVFLETRQPHFVTCKILTVTNHVFSTANLFFANHLDLFYLYRRRTFSQRFCRTEFRGTMTRKPVASESRRNSPLRRRRFPATVNRVPAGAAR